MPEKIGAQLGVTGESSYSKAMRDAAKNTKALDSELKLAEAQFKATGDAQELMNSKGKILKEQLSEQEKAVQTAKQALEYLASNGYDKTSTKVMEWRAKLAQAEQQVLEINAAIANNEAGLDSAGKAYEGLGDSMQQVGQDADTLKTDLDLANGSAGGLMTSLKNIGSLQGWEGIQTSLHNLNSWIDRGIQKAAQLATALWDAGVDATVWADTLLTDATVFGIDTKTLQQWQYASRFVDSSVDTIVGARKKLLTNMSSSSKDMALAFNSLNVATRDTDGSLRDIDDVFWSVIAALKEIDNTEERDAAAMKVLGKSAAELNPLIEAGREEWEKYANAAPIISEDKVKSLGSANDAIEDMNAQLEALKLDALAYLAPIIQDVASAMASAAQSFREFLETDEGQQALTAMQEAVSGLLSDFTELDFGTLLTNASDTLSAIFKTFTDIVSDKDKIKNAFTIIGTGVVALKVAEAATQAASLLASLNAIKLFNVGSAAAGAAGAAAGAAGAAKTGIVGKAATLATGAASSLAVTKVGAIAAKAIPTLGPLASVLTMGSQALMDLTETGRVLRDTGDISKTVETAGKELHNWAEDVAHNAETFASDWAAVWDNIKKATGLQEVESKVGHAFDAGGKAVQNWADGVLHNAETFADDWAAVWENVRNLFGIPQPTEAKATDQKEEVMRISAKLAEKNDNPDLMAAWNLLADEVLATDWSATADVLYDLADRYQRAFLGDLEDEPVIEELFSHLDQETDEALSKALEDIAWYGSEGMLDPATATALISRVREQLAKAIQSSDKMETELTATGEAVGVTLSEAVTDQAEKLEKAGETTGEYAAVGVANGIDAKADAAAKAAERLAEAVRITLANTLEIESPSKVAERLGGYFGEGFSIGLSGTKAEVLAATKDMMSGLQLKAPAYADPVRQPSDAGMVPGLILSALSQMRVQIDGKDAGTILLPTLEELMGEQIISRRYA